MAAHQAHQLLRQLCLAYNKLDESHKARQDLHEHIQSIRQLANDKNAKPANIHASLKELESKIEHALDSQGKIKSVEPFNERLLKRLAAIEKQVDGFLKQQDKKRQEFKKTKKV